MAKHNVVYLSIQWNATLAIKRNEVNATWMNPRNVMSNERSQIQKVTHYLSPFT